MKSYSSSIQFPDISPLFMQLEFEIIIGLWRYNVASMVALSMSLKLFRVDTQLILCIVGYLYMEWFACRSALIDIECSNAKTVTPA